MKLMTKVDDMSQAQMVQQAQTDKRKTRLSPELNEFLHMMKALETEFGPDQQKR